MRVSIFILTLLLLVIPFVNETADGAGKTIAVLPFYDDSGYRGPWHLRTEMPIMLGDMLMDDYFAIVPMDSIMEYYPKPPKKNIFKKFLGLFSNQKEVQRILTDLEVVSIARKVDADFAIVGIIEDYTFRRTGGGDVLIGGYKSYTAKVALSHVRVIRVADGTPMGTVQGESNKNERGLGLELLGKPRQRDLEFYSLDSLDFGSKRFVSTMMGQATVEALNKVQKDLRAIITLPDTNWFAEKKFKIISQEAGMAFINAGSADGVKPGDKFNVFASESGVLVGKINVTMVMSDHVAKVEVLQGQDAIRAEDVIMPE